MLEALIRTNFTDNIKVKRILKRLGYQGGWYLFKFILWVAANKDNGDLKGMKKDDIELAVNWDGDAGAFAGALADYKFLDGDEGSYVVHKWSTYQGKLLSSASKVTLDDQKVTLQDRKVTIADDKKVTIGDQKVTIGGGKVTLPQPNIALTKDKPLSAKISSQDRSSESSQDSLEHFSLASEDSSTLEHKHIGVRGEKRGKVTLGKGRLVVTFDQFMAACVAAKEDAIPSSYPVYDYAAKNNISAELLVLCWTEFKTAYVGNLIVKQAGDVGWRLKFRRCVVENWYRLWDDAGRPTPKAKMLMRQQGTETKKRPVV